MANGMTWEIICRNEEELREIFAPTPFGENITVIAEQAQVNLLAMATKD